MKTNQEQRILRVAILVETTISWSRALVSGILQYSHEHGPWHIHLEPQLQDNALHLPENWQGDGIIARVSTLEIANELKALNLPVVNISSIRIKGVDFPRVQTSEESQANVAYETFRSRGFKNYAYVGEVGLGYVKRHFNAYRNKVESEGYKLHAYDSSQKNMLGEWLSNLPKPAAVFCWGPSLGHLVIDTCQLKGIKVPHDVAVLGSDYDELLSESSYPAQAGIVMAADQVGVIAASLLQQMIEGKVPEKKNWELEATQIMEKLSIDTLSVTDTRMTSVMEYLQQHALEPICVDDVLRANPMARRSLERKFRDTFGCSVLEQIRQLRVNHARKLLAETNAPITDISEKCGFSSYNYLNRVFKNITGLTPSQYREQCSKRVEE